MSRWLLALLLAAAGCSRAGAHDALDAIDACLRQLDPGLDVGYQRIAARCPDLAPSLAQSPWAAWLPRDWNQPANLLSADGLTQLRTLLTRAPAEAVAPGTPGAEHVAAVLARITPADQPRGRWWTRFRQWVREMFAPQSEGDERGLVRRLFGELHLSEVFLEGIAWAVLALVVALAGAVVINELRVAGVLKARAPAPGRARDGTAACGALTLEQLERTSPLEQPALLLELITRRLAELERLPPARSLTVHELTRAARLARESDREQLRELATISERVRFSDRPQAPHSLAAALSHGRALLAALETEAPQPQETGRAHA